MTITDNHYYYIIIINLQYQFRACTFLNSYVTDLVDLILPLAVSKIFIRRSRSACFCCGSRWVVMCLVFASERLTLNSSRGGQLWNQPYFSYCRTKFSDAGLRFEGNYKSTFMVCTNTPQLCPCVPLLYVHKGYTYSNWLSLFKLVISIQQMASEICDDTKVSIYIS